MGGGGSKPPPGNNPPPGNGGGGGGGKPPPGNGGGGGGSKPPPNKPPGGGQNPPPGNGGGQNPPPGSGNGGSGGNSPPSNGGGGCESCISPPDSSQDNAKPQPAGPSHPLNQLDEDEIKETVRIIYEYAQNQGITEELIFASVSLLEPEKKLLLPYLQGQTRAMPPRKSWSVVSPSGINAAYEVVVNLDTKQIDESLTTPLPEGTQPSFNADDPIIIQDAVRKDERIIERARKVGITDMENLICDAWSYGYNNTEEDRKHLRLMDMYLYKRNYAGDNQYAHPLDFFVTVDVVERKIIDIVDLPVCPGNEPSEAERPIPPPEESHNYDPRVLGLNYFRNDIKPLEITQPDGPSFTIKGNTIKWQRWEMIIGFNFREGLTLHNITFEDHKKSKEGKPDKDIVEKRNILYRAALSEMVVPYGDPRTPYYRKSAFDLGEYGLGYNANPLVNSCDCKGEIRYLDFVFANSKGEPQVTRNAVCIHEEDAGLLQKHTEFRNGNVTIARSRKLVISFIATVTNYDYLFYWNFFQDGTMQVDVQATGLLSVHSLGLKPECGPGGYGIIAADRINAPYHQHIFCARLDTMIDGTENSVAMQEVVPLEDDSINPFHQGFTTRSTIFETAKDAATDTNPDTTRSWIVINEDRKNPYTKQFVGWKLVAPGFSRMLAQKESGVYQRGGFATHNVWVTPYKEGQLYAAGKYINQAPGDKQDGLPYWTEQNENIRKTDIVLWHTFGLTHVPRVEDYPLMPVEGASFVFRPSNFFNQNPALDVPPPNKKKNNKN